MDIDYTKIPEHIRYAMFRYIRYGEIPGDFLQQVICNRLVQSFGAADTTNTMRMLDIIGFIYNDAPAQCWGSEEIMRKWEGISNPAVKHIGIPDNWFDKED